MRASDWREWSKAMSAKDETARRGDIKELETIYKNRWRDRIQEELEAFVSADILEDLEYQIATDLNPLWYAANELGKIYSKSPKRTIDGVEMPEDGDDPLEPYLANGTLDLALDQAARLGYACRSVGLRVLAANIPEPGGEKPKEPPHAVLDVIPSHKLFVVPDATDQTRLQLVVVRKEKEYVAWDHKEVIHYDLNFAETRRYPNPYGIIPYVIAHASYPAGEYWGTSEAFGLRDGSYQLAIAATAYNHLRWLQSHKQGWYRSDDELPVSVTSDPGRWFRVTGDGEVGLLDLQADLPSHIESMIDRAALSLAQYGIRPESVRGMLDASSGVALALKLTAQISVWEQQRKVWDVWEQRLYEVAQAVMRVDAGIALPPGRMIIDWADIGPQASAQEQAPEAYQGKEAEEGYARARG